MNQGIKLVVYPVSDLARAKAIYGKLLGVDPYTDEAFYVGFRTGDHELGLDPNGHAKGITGPLGYCEVSDIRATLKSLVDAGAQTHQDVTNVGGGKVIATVKDADGNVLGLLQSP